MAVWRDQRGMWVVGGGGWLVGWLECYLVLTVHSVLLPGIVYVCVCVCVCVFTHSLMHSAAPSCTLLPVTPHSSPSTTLHKNTHPHNIHAQCCCERSSSVWAGSWS